ncbi:MAG: hypothetical protein COA47_09905, partial [Robiginitomaculum sp.]
FADGGEVKGRGTGRSDSILANVSKGEFVMNAQATKRNRALLEEMNKKGAPSFANGGMVGATPVAVQGEKQPITIVNVTDPKMVEEFLATPAGERAIVNVMQRNASAINAVLG